MKTDMYLQSIEHLITAIDEKIATTEENDRKNDLSVLRDSAVVLRTEAGRVFGGPIQTGGRRMIRRY